uniref:Uncharacterized protein n=1 Tax=Arundo donax TaxID=35708 RepID=A0A0A9H9S3_ARUDO
MPWMDIPILCKEFQHAGCGGHYSCSLTMAVHGRQKVLLHLQAAICSRIEKYFLSSTFLLMWQHPFHLELPCFRVVCWSELRIDMFFIGPITTLTSQWVYWIKI